MRRLALYLPFVFVVLSVAGCGASSRMGRPTTSSQTTSPAPTTTQSTATQPSGPGALQAEANSAAAGDIPDNQVFLVFRNSRAGYSMKYPEGWAQRGSAKSVVFRDKNNIVRVVVGTGVAPTNATAERGLSRVHVVSAPQKISVSGDPALKVVYSTESAPNAVTAKRATFVVDRYYLWKKGRLAIVDLGTPQGVDNVDAYRLMIESFRWR